MVGARAVVGLITVGACVRFGDHSVTILTACCLCIDPWWNIVDVDYHRALW